MKKVLFNFSLCLNFIFCHMKLTIYTCNKERQKDKIFSFGKIHHKGFENKNKEILHTNKILLQITNMKFNILYKPQRRNE